MSLNQNGLYAASWTVVNSHTQISEGAVVGIVFGWIIAAVLLYIIGVCIIVKKVSDNSEKQQSKSESGDQSSQKKDSKDKQSNQKQSSGSAQKKYEGKRTKKILQSNPTSMELAESQKANNIGIMLKINESSFKE